MARESLVPGPGSLVLSAGPAMVRDTIGLPFFRISTKTTDYGGNLALDYFASKAVSIGSELTVTTAPGGTNFIETVNHHGTTKTVALNMPARIMFLFDVDARYYPLQLTRYADFRLQPFVKVAVGGMLFVSPPSSFGESSSIDPCPFASAGGGTDFVFNSRWSATAIAQYYSSLSDTTAHLNGIPFSARDHGVEANVGIRYRFW